MTIINEKDIAPTIDIEESVIDDDFEYKGR